MVQGHSEAANDFLNGSKLTILMLCNTRAERIPKKQDVDLWRDTIQSIIDIVFDQPAEISSEEDEAAFLLLMFNRLTEVVGLYSQTLAEFLLTNGKKTKLNAALLPHVSSLVTALIIMQEKLFTFLLGSAALGGKRNLNAQ